MTRVTCALSGFNPRRVLGTGTALDTARLRYLLGEYFSVDPRNIHAYVMGEHGDSEFVPWSQAMLATKPILTICEESGGRFCTEDMEKITEEVRGAAQKIITAKKPPITASVWRWCASPGPFSAMKAASSPSPPCCGGIWPKQCVCGRALYCGRNGIQRTLTLSLNDQELEQFRTSCDTLREFYDGLQIR